MKSTLGVMVCGLLLSALACAQPTPSGDMPSSNSRQQVDAELRQLLIDTINQSDSFEDRFDAEVWLVSKRDSMGRFVKDPEQRMDLLRRIHQAATQADLQPEIVLALIEVESHFNRFAISRVGAQGMMQVMPFWKKEIGRPGDNLTDIDTNLLYGCTILKHYLKRSNGRLIEALARYNGSYGKTWYPRRVMNAWEKHWR
jgi:soluble lytic murein transglycosylase-like protein